VFYDFPLQNNNQLFPLSSWIVITGEDQSQANQPNSLAEGPHVKLNLWTLRNIMNNDCALEKAGEETRWGVVTEHAHRRERMNLLNRWAFFLLLGLHRIKSILD
jgi:hypothetical protein